MTPPGRLVTRPVAALRPYAPYLALCGPIPATRVQRVAQQPGALREPLVITTDGTILDGHVRWQVAKDRQLSSLPCLEYDLTEAEALEVVIDRHGSSQGLNAFCRIRLALSYTSLRQSASRRQGGEGPPGRASNLTPGERRQVRKDIARVARVSTGNVTKVRQLLETVIPHVQDALRRGEVSIHKAWQWRTLTPTRQRDAVWAHRHRTALKQTIRLLIAPHTRRPNVVPPGDQVRTVLGGLATHETAVGVIDLPGNAIVVTRECYEGLLRRRGDDPRGRATA